MFSKIPKWFFLFPMVIATMIVIALIGTGATGAASINSNAPEHRGANQDNPNGPIVIQADQASISPPLSSISVPPYSTPDEIREIPLGPSLFQGLINDRDVPDPVVQSEFGPGVIPPTIQNFEGVNNVNGVLPPDTNGDVGPNHYVEMVNISLAVYDKSGNLLLGPIPNNALWAGFGGPCEVDNSGDPIVLYDELADRWLLSQFAVDTGAHECIAISTTPDPTGAYYRYAFNIGGFPDYPKLSVWPDAYYATYRNFGDTFDMQASAMNRAKMLVGDPTAELIITSISAGFAPLSVDGFLPVDLDGAAPPVGAPGLFIGQVYDELGHVTDALSLQEMHVDWTNPGNSTFSAPVILETAPVNDMCDGNRDCIPQPDTDQGLDAIGDRLLFRAAYRNFGFYQAIVTTATTDTGGEHAGKRWYELRDSGFGWGIFQQGTYAPDGDHRWMGSIAMDVAGNIGLGYSVSSETVYPSIRYTGRLVTDLLGVLPQGEGTIIAGSGSQTHSAARWGDYSSMSVDPVDGCTFWYANEYIQTTGSAPWQTRIASFKFDECPNPSQQDFSIWGQPAKQAICAPDNAEFDLSIFAIGGYTETVTLNSSGVPAGSSVGFSTNPVDPSGTSVMTLSNTGAATEGDYDIVVTGLSSTRTHSTTMMLSLFTDPPAGPALASPADGAVNQPIQPTLEWTALGDPANFTYAVELATDAGFNDIVESASNLVGTTYLVTTVLDFNTTYYWRVRASNTCGEGNDSAVFSFSTAGDGSCPPGQVANIIFNDDLDSSAPGWTHSAAVGPDTWSLVDTNPSPGSGGFSWLSVDHSAPSDQRLVSPVINLPSGESLLTLQFLNEQNFEDPAGSGSGCWDGGMLEYTTDGGANWIQFDSELLTDPYDGTGNNGPPAGLRLWCGTTGGHQDWLNSLVDLDALGGSTAQFRWSMLTDAAAGAEGWYIDDVLVQSCVESAPSILLPLVLAGPK